MKNVSISIVLAAWAVGCGSDVASDSTPTPSGDAVPVGSDAVPAGSDAMGPEVPSVANPTVDANSTASMDANGATTAPVAPQPTPSAMPPSAMPPSDEPPATDGSTATDGPTATDAVPPDPLPDDGAVPALVMPVDCAADTEIGMGVYRVPATPDLANSSSIAVEEITFCVSAGALVLDYDLPELLVGTEQSVTFDGVWNQALGRFDLTGELGRGYCRGVGRDWTCFEMFDTSLVDFEELDKVLAALPADQIAGRRAVAEQFGQDPIGFLDLTLP